ncbi:MAG: PhzF family phenazine biosynthesis protein [Planctomycetota bacterium]
MQLPIFQVDAFTDRVFGGNPAAVVPLEAWLDDGVMQAVAAENALSETAFVVREGHGWRIRWFTPVAEVALCGHATLATASVLFEEGMVAGDELRLESRSGTLRVLREGGLYVLDFPALRPEPIDPDPALAAALGREPLELWKARDHIAVLEDEDEVRALTPDLAALGRHEGYAVIATAPGRTCDFVSRFFAPKVGVPEDPVTGSAHCELTPLWSARLGRTLLEARQLSARGGALRCEDRGGRVRIGGRAVRYLDGSIRVPG